MTNWDIDTLCIYIYLYIIYLRIFVKIEKRKVGFGFSFNKAFGWKFCCRNLEENCVKFWKEFRVVKIWNVLFFFSWFRKDAVACPVSTGVTDVNAFDIYTAPAAKSARCLLAGATASVFGLKQLAFLNSPTTLSSLGDIQRILPGKKTWRDCFPFSRQTLAAVAAKKEPFPQRRCLRCFDTSTQNRWILSELAREVCRGFGGRCSKKMGDVASILQKGGAFGFGFKDDGA